MLTRYVSVSKATMAAAPFHAAHISGLRPQASRASAAFGCARSAAAATWTLATGTLSESSARALEGSGWPHARKSDCAAAFMTALMCREGRRPVVAAILLYARERLTSALRDACVRFSALFRAERFRHGPLVSADCSKAGRHRPGRASGVTVPPWEGLVRDDRACYIYRSRSRYRISRAANVTAQSHSRGGGYLRSNSRDTFKTRALISGCQWRTGGSSH